MKNCAICKAENAAEAVTCVACGEGSFGADTGKSAPAKKAAHSPVIDDAVASEADEVLAEDQEVKQHPETTHVAHGAHGKRKGR